jgi:hypothetical protein
MTIVIKNTINENNIIEDKHIDILIENNKYEFESTNKYKNYKILDIIQKGGDGIISNAIFNDIKCYVKTFDIKDGIPHNALREIAYMKLNIKKNILGIRIDKNLIHLFLKDLGKSLIDTNNDELFDYSEEISNLLINKIKDIHKKLYYHGDISMGNIIINNDHEVNLIDYSRSNKIHRTFIRYNPTSYIIPYEIAVMNIKKENNFNIKHIEFIKYDLWGVANMLYYINTGTLLSIAQNSHEQLIEIDKLSSFKKISLMLKKSKSKHVTIIKELLNLNIDMRKILEYPSYNYYYNFLKNNKYVNKKINNYNRIINELIKFSNQYNLPDETIFLTINNLLNLDMYKTPVNTIIMHMISIKLITDYNFNIDIIINWIGSKNIYAKKIEKQKIVELECLIMKKLDWNYDSLNAYDYIIFIKDEYHKIFCKLMLNYYMDIQFAMLEETEKLKIIQNILFLNYKDNYLRYEYINDI